jgi:hypothetical protein
VFDFDVRLIEIQEIRQIGGRRKHGSNGGGSLEEVGPHEKVATSIL